MAGKNDRPSAFSLNPSDRRFARPDVNRANPEVRAVLAKLVSDNMPRPGSIAGNRAISIPDDTYLKKISDSTSARVSDSEALFQVLPDTELSSQILISSILSPKDMTNTDLTFTVESGSMETELVGAMLQVIEEFFDKTYKIKKILQPILQDVLFMTGSYPLLVLPENTIDDAINSPQRVSMESLRGVLDANGELPSMGFLGPVKKPATNGTVPALESIYGQLPHHITAPTHDMEKVAPFGNGERTFDPRLSVTDNISMLKLPILREKVRHDRTQDILSMHHNTTLTHTRRVAMEARAEKIKRGKPIAETTAQVEASLYKKRKYRNVPVFSLIPGDMLPAATVGHPMVVKCPSESIIPVHVPGNPDEHIGYFMLVDDRGNPVVKAQTADYYTDMTTNINTNRDMVSQLTATVRRAEKGREPNDQETEDDILQAYTDLVEEDLLARLKNGIYGDDVEISRPQEVYRVMLARALAQMKTKLLYIPTELMTYIAFDYNRYGIGASVLEKSRILGSIRAIMLFAATMSMIKNSVAREVLNITLDPNDKTPSETVEFMIHEYAKTRQASYPVGASNPLDIINFLQNAGVSIAVSGNTAYPETKLEIEDRASNKAKPDQELMEELKNQHIMSMGLSPETVNQGANAEFATTIVTSNLLLTKRVIQYQEKLCYFLEDHIQKYTLSSGYLMEALRQCVKDNKASIARKEREARQKAKDDAQAAKDAAASADETSTVTGDDGNALAPSPSDGNTDLSGNPAEETPDEEEEGNENEEEEEEEEEEGGTSSNESLEDNKDMTGSTRPDRSKQQASRILTDPETLNEAEYGEDAIVIAFIHALKVSLPAPDTVTLENQMAAFDKYVEALDKALKAYIDPEWLDETTFGELSGTVQATVNVLRAYFIRQWLRNNRVLPELDAIANMGGDGEAFDLLEMNEGYIEGLMVSLGGFMKDLKEKQEAVALANGIQNLGNTPPADGGDGGLGGDDGLGGLGGDDGLGGDTGEETPPNPDETPEGQVQEGKANLETDKDQQQQQKDLEGGDKDGEAGGTGIL